MAMDRWLTGVVGGTVGAQTIHISRFQLVVQRSMETLNSQQTVIYIYNLVKEVQST